MNFLNKTGSDLLLCAGSLMTPNIAVSELVLERLSRSLENLDFA